MALGGSQCQTASAPCGPPADPAPPFGAGAAGHRQVCRRGSDAERVVHRRERGSPTGGGHDRSGRQRLFLRRPGGDCLDCRRRGGAVQPQCELHVELIGSRALRVHRGHGRLRGERHRLRERIHRDHATVLRLRLHPHHGCGHRPDVQHPRPFPDAAADELHRLPTADRTDHQLGRPRAQGGRRQRRGHHAEPAGGSGDRERPRWHELRARGVLHRRAAGGVGGLREQGGLGERSRPVRRSRPPRTPTGRPRATATTRTPRRQ